MERAALVIPGSMYGPHVPLLRYSADAAEVRGARIRHLHWEPPYDPDVTPPEEAGPWVSAQVSPVGDGTLLIGEHYSKQADGPGLAQVSCVASGGRPTFE